jgi:hypothetical protein
MTEGDAPAILDSARRHGVADHDILHAFRNPMWVEPVEDDDLLMYIGPSESAEILEVGVVEARDGGPLIVHAMPVRDKFLIGR